MSQQQHRQNKFTPFMTTQFIHGFASGFICILFAFVVQLPPTIRTRDSTTSGFPLSRSLFPAVNELLIEFHRREANNGQLIEWLGRLDRSQRRGDEQQQQEERNIKQSSSLKSISSNPVTQYITNGWY